jgi:hypothetical protein
MSKYSFPNQLVKDIPDAVSFEVRTTDSGKLMCCIYGHNKEPISEHLAYLNFSEKTEKTYHSCFTEPSRSLRTNDDFLKNFTFDPKIVMKLVDEHCHNFTRDEKPYGETKTGNKKYKVRFQAGDIVLAIGTVIELKNRHSHIYATDYAYSRSFKEQES